jgi:hypothetical protein
LLDRAETLSRRQAFNCDDMRSIELVHRLKAARNGPIAQAAPDRPSDQNSARPTVAFATTDLGSDQVALFTQEFDERAKCRVAVQDDALTIQVNKDVIRHVELGLDYQRDREGSPWPELGPERGRPALSIARSHSRRYIILHNRGLLQK